MPYRKLRNFKSWSHIDPLSKKLKFNYSKDIQFFTWSNHNPCYEANMFVHQRMLAKIANSTLKQEAGLIIHLIHFVEQQPSLTSFNQLTDATFTLFVQNLQNEREPTGELKRSNNRVIDIAEKCLDFLKFIQDLNDLSHFIGSDKANAIRTTEKPYKIKIDGHKGYKICISISHNSIPSKDAIRTRHPISSSDSLKLWNYLKAQPVGRDKRTRDKAMYVVMEQLGARITEFHLITISDYEEARKTGSIKLTTLKRKEDKHRFLPIPQMVLNYIAPYIKIRKRVMNKKRTKHDMLFINLNNGEAFSPSSWGAYLNQWKREIGIEGNLHAHLYRHAFITDKLKEIILAHNEINGKDGFRKHLLHTKAFKQELQQWTGHTLLSSLDTYIDLVFEDINGYTETYNAVSLKNSVTLIKRQLTDLKDIYKKKELTLGEYNLRLNEMLNSFEQDIDNSINT
ncbi:site-specific integrase [Aliivibrio salmonicida]|uniref:Phage recombinase/integrase n=1 Tax=Aliivibrio salmonicida (strain LFI1238) TaxID=316275 RepID=B6EIE0_ALISL|nr:tyrosine-type recombinase/integrase [Aliivibrio salmonicida]AZL84320.1 site-specific integrase [Aliivibrio salmonicida]CAQ78651.1 putative phage recombinase/integrase [Aliivibrio salmonicida LFI1238]